MRSYQQSIAMIAVLWVVVNAVASPVRRSPDLEARRRSAIDRSMIRFGRSYPPEPSAADIREAFQRPTRRGNSFLRLGRSQQPFTAEDLINLLHTYEEDYGNPAAKRVSNFIRLGRDPKFIRFGRSIDDERNELEQSSNLVVSGYPHRINRARDHFVRLGRDSEELNEGEVEEEPTEDSRRKRSTEPCSGCQ